MKTAPMANNNSRKSCPVMMCPPAEVSVPIPQRVGLIRLVILVARQGLCRDHENEPDQRTGRGTRKPVFRNPQCAGRPEQEHNNQEEPGAAHRPQYALCDHAVVKLNGTRIWAWLEVSPQIVMPRPSGLGFLTTTCSLPAS